MQILSVVAFLMWKRAATTPKCLLKYQRANGEKDLRLFIYTSLVTFDYKNVLANRNFVAHKDMRQSTETNPWK